MAIGEPQMEVPGAEVWHPKIPDNSTPLEAPLNVESQQTEVTVDELVKNIGGGWDEKTAMTGVTKESAQKLLKDAYQIFDAEYEKRNTEDNSAKLDNLEKLIDLLQAKRKEPDVAEAIPEAKVEMSVEVTAEDPKEVEEAPVDNVIDKKEEFTKRTQMNEALKSARNLAFEMYGEMSALTQGSKILPEVKAALNAVRLKMAELSPGQSMNSDIVETLAVLRRGIDNQRKEQQRKNPRGDMNLESAYTEVDNFIAEIKPKEQPKVETKTESISA